MASKWIRILQSSAMMRIKNNNIFNPSTYRLNTTAIPNSPGRVEKLVNQKLSSALKPIHLEVINESPSHNVPTGSESHFKVIIVSSQFEKLPHVQRHRLVNAALTDELANDIHALSIVARTPAQWQAERRANPSPPCLGGSTGDSSAQSKTDPKL